MLVSRITAAWRRVLLLTGVGIAAGLLVTAALAVAVPPAQGFAPARKAKAPTLASLLLTVPEMPIGWNVVSSQGSGSGGCLDHALEPPGLKQTASATVTFAFGGSAMDEKLATYAAPASTVFAKIVATLDRCKTVKVQTRFPRYGDQSAAFDGHTTVDGLPVSDEVLVAIKGTILVGIAEDGFGSPDLGQFKGFVGKALARLP